VTLVIARRYAWFRPPPVPSWTGGKGGVLHLAKANQILRAQPNTTQTSHLEHGQISASACFRATDGIVMALVQDRVQAGESGRRRFVLCTYCVYIACLLTCSQFASPAVRMRVVMVRE